MLLCIYTNTHKTAPSTEVVRATYKSFCETFDPEKQMPVIVYCDINPRTNVATKYLENLERFFPKVVVTRSLSDGYLRSIHDSERHRYIFQLEGDWIFNYENIDHSYGDIIDFMEVTKTYHFRFNKRENKVAVWDKKMEPGEHNGFKFCRSNNLSNNPHIIDRERYQKEISKHIIKTPGSKGIEERLNKVGKYESILYGGPGHPATITHLDGRGVWR
jgi:hypothetical protein